MSASSSIHAKGETDDATWVWAADRSIVSGGDLLAGILPNCGNPQKVQRYPEEWADALEAIASVGRRAAAARAREARSGEPT